MAKKLLIRFFKTILNHFKSAVLFKTTHLPIYLSIYLSIYLLSIYLSFYLSIFLLSSFLPSFLSDLSFFFLSIDRKEWEERKEDR